MPLAGISFDLDDNSIGAVSVASDDQSDSSSSAPTAITFLSIVTSGDPRKGTHTQVLRIEHLDQGARIFEAKPALSRVSNLDCGTVCHCITTQSVDTSRIHCIAVISEDHLFVGLTGCWADRDRSCSLDSQYPCTRFLDLQNNSSGDSVLYVHFWRYISRPK